MANTAASTPPPRDDRNDYVYRKSFRHWITGKIIVAPPGKVFRFPRRKR
jgi:hypothetical protein